MPYASVGFALFGILAGSVAPIVDHHQAASASAAVAQRERPAIQAALERLLAAERSKDLEAIRGQVTRGTLSTWDRDVREGICQDLRDCISGSALFSDTTTRVDITWLGVDERARWALVAVKGLGLSSTVDLFREDGVWKADGQMHEWVAMFGALKVPTVPAVSSLANVMLIGADLPSGWQLVIDEVRSKTAGRRYYLAEMRGFTLERGGHVDGHLEYRVFSDVAYADWYFWRARQLDDEAEMFDVAGQPTKTLAAAVAMLTSTSFSATYYTRKGRIIAEVEIMKQTNEYCTDLATDIGTRALRKLK